MQTERLFELAYSIHASCFSDSIQREASK